MNTNNISRKGAKTQSFAKKNTSRTEHAEVTEKTKRHRIGGEAEASDISSCSAIPSVHPLCETSPGFLGELCVFARDAFFLLWNIDDRIPPRFFRRQVVGHRHQQRGAGRQVAAFGRVAARSSERRFVRADAECRHGVAAGPTAAEAVSDSQHARRHPRRRRPADRPRLSHGALRSRFVDAGRSGGVGPAGGVAVRRVCQRSVRRSHAGNDRHDGQPAVSQRCGHRAQAADPVAADPAGRHRRGDLRQRFAGDDDGFGGPTRFAVCYRSWRRDAAAGAGGRRRQSADNRREVRSR